MAAVCISGPDVLNAVSTAEWPLTFREVAQRLRQQTNSRPEARVRTTDEFNQELSAVLKELRHERQLHQDGQGRWSVKRNPHSIRPRYSHQAGGTTTSSNGNGNGVNHPQIAPLPKVSYAAV